MAAVQSNITGEEKDDVIEQAAGLGAPE